MNILQSVLKQFPKVNYDPTMPRLTLGYYPRLLTHKMPWRGDKVTILLSSGPIREGMRVVRILRAWPFIPVLVVEHSTDENIRRYYVRRTDFRWSDYFDSWVPKIKANYR